MENLKAEQWYLLFNMNLKKPWKKWSNFIIFIAEFVFPHELPNSCFIHPEQETENISEWKEIKKIKNKWEISKTANYLNMKSINEIIPWPETK